MTRTPEEMDAAITRIETILGSWTQTIGQLRPIRPPELPNQFYPVDKSMQQLYDSENALNLAFKGLDARMKLLDAKVGAIVLPDPIPPSSSGSAGAVNLPGFGNGVHFKQGMFEGLVFVSDFDDAMRILYNHKDNTSDGHTYAIETRPQLRIDIEKDGAISMGYFKPRKKINPDGSIVELTPGPYDNQGGKGLVFRPGGSEADGRRSRYAEIFSGLQNRGLRFGVAGATAPNAVDEWSIVIEPDGSVKTR